MDMADACLGAGVRRLEGTLNGVPVRRAIQGPHDGERFLIIGQDLLRQMAVAEGDTVVAELRPDADPDAVDLPDELAIALQQDQEAAGRFEAKTIGFRRSLALYVTQAKRTETRIRRSLEVTRRLRTDSLWGESRPNR
jgi:hypothetical protein